MVSLSYVVSLLVVVSLKFVVWVMHGLVWVSLSRYSCILPTLAALSFDPRLRGLRERSVCHESCASF